MFRKKSITLEEYKNKAIQQDSFTHGKTLDDVEKLVDFLFYNR